MAEDKSYDIDDILSELQGIPAEPTPEEEPAETVEAAEPTPEADAASAPKKFVLHLDLDSEYGDLPDDFAAPKEEEEVRVYEPEPKAEEPVHIEEEPETPEAPETPETPAAPAVPKFELHLDLDSEYGDLPDDFAAPAAPTATPAPKAAAPRHTATGTPSRGGYAPRSYDVTSTEDTAAEEPTDDGESKPKPKQKLEGWGCLFATLYGTVILALSIFLSYTIIVGFLDFTAIGKEDVVIDITVPKDVTNSQLADILEEAELIDEAWIFRIYASLVDGEGNWQPGEYSLSPKMGYQTLSSRLRTAAPREVARVTIPEGYTVPQIAKRLEESGICSASDFMVALDKDYSKSYDFIADLRHVPAEDRQARVHELEGYLFPDTYDFYKGCSAETVVRKMLDNFDSRMTTQFRAAAKEQGLTIDQVVILASIVQGEANNPDDMAGVARVFFNRLNNPAVYPRLESDATGAYLEKLFGDKEAVAKNETYNTYNRVGLPVGAVNCPGQDAIRAVLWPANDNELTCTCQSKGNTHKGESAKAKKYYFATYYSKTEEKFITGYHATLDGHNDFVNEYDIHD